MRSTIIAVVVTLLVVAGAWYLAGSGTGELERRIAVADSISAVARDSANAARALLVDALATDSARAQAMQDSVEVYAARAAEERRRASVARRQAAGLATALETSLDSLEVALLTDYTALRDVEVAAVTVERDDALAERDMWRAARESALGLLEISRAESAELRQALLQATAGSQLRDAVIRRQRRRAWLVHGTEALVVVALLTDRIF